MCFVCLRCLLNLLCVVVVVVCCCCCRFDLVYGLSVVLVMFLMLPRFVLYCCVVCFMMCCYVFVLCV